MSRVRTHRRPADPRPQGPHDRYLDMAGVRYHYLDMPGTEPAVFMVHGFASSTHTWEETAPRINAAGRRVVALDLKGFGWSDKPLPDAYDPVTLTRETDAFLSALGLDRVAYVGNSLGGAIGWLLALANPSRVDRLILIDAAAYRLKTPHVVSLGRLPGAAAAARLFFGRWAVRAVMKQVYFHHDRITEDRVAAYAARLRGRNALAVQAAVGAALTEDVFAGPSARIPEITAPTLIIWGRDDAWIPLETVGRRLAADIPKSELVVIPECGHVPQEEAPEIVAEAILEFLGKGATDGYTKTNAIAGSCNMP